MKLSRVNRIEATGLLSGLIVCCAFSLWGGSGLVDITFMVWVIWISFATALFMRHLYLTYENKNYRVVGSLFWLVVTFAYPSFLGFKLHLMYEQLDVNKVLAGSLEKQTSMLATVNARDDSTLEEQCRASAFIAGQIYRGHGVTAEVVSCDGVRVTYAPTPMEIQWRQRWLSNSEHSRRVIPWMWLHLFISVIITGAVVILTMMKKRKKNEFSH